MDNLLLHTKSRTQLEGFLKNPSHTIAISGEAGTGKGIVAMHIAAGLLSCTVEQLGIHPYFRTYKPEGNTISIETAREITGLIKLKTTGVQAIRRVIIIENAQAMTIEAQNALLKTFEEPPSDTVFILTITDTSSLLPTIISRLQIVQLQPLIQAEVIEHFAKAGHDQTKVRQYYFMSNGLVGLMDALLSDGAAHPLAESIQQAKSILQSDSFERLIMIDQIVKNKQTSDIIAALCTISRSALYFESERDNAQEKMLKRWASVLQSAEEARRLLGQNTQPKLVLTSLFLEI